MERRQCTFAHAEYTGLSAAQHTALLHKISGYDNSLAFPASETPFFWSLPAWGTNPAAQSVTESVVLRFLGVQPVSAEVRFCLPEPLPAGPVLFVAGREDLPCVQDWNAGRACRLCVVERDLSDAGVRPAESCKNCIDKQGRRSQTASPVLSAGSGPYFGAPCLRQKASLVLFPGAAAPSFCKAQQAVRQLLTTHMPCLLIFLFLCSPSACLSAPISS